MAVAFRSTNGILATEFASTVSPSVTKPTGAADGDLMLMLVVTETTTDMAASCAGWTQVASEVNTASNDSTVGLYWRIHSGDGSSWTMTNLFNSTESGGAVVMCYTGVHQTVPIHKYAGGSQGSSGPSLTTTVRACMIVQFNGCDPGTGGYSGTADTDPAATERHDAKIGSNNYAYVYIQEYLQSAAGECTLTPSVTADNYGCYEVALTDATHAFVDAVVSTATGDVLVPTLAVAANISPPVVAATGTVVTTNASIAYVIYPSVITATGAVPEHTAATSTGTVVAQESPVAATGAIPVHTLTWGAAVQAEKATATGAVPVHTVGAGAGVSGEKAEASGAVLVPGVTAAAEVLAQPAGASAAIPVHTVSAAASVSAEIATATGAIPSEQAVSVNWAVEAALAQAAAVVLSVGIGAGLFAAPATASAEIPVPGVSIAVAAVTVTATGSIPQPLLPGAGLNEIIWTNISANCSADGNTLTKNSGGWNYNAGAISLLEVPSGDCRFEFTESNSTAMCGLSSGDPGVTWEEIDFAVYGALSGNVSVWESGSQKYSADRGYVTGHDVLSVAIESGVIKYYHNGALIYTSEGSPSYPVLVDCSIYAQGGSITAWVSDEFSSIPAGIAAATGEVLVPGVTAAANIAPWGPATAWGGNPSSLHTRLVAYWPFEEASGDRASVVGSHDLTPTGTTGQGTGKNGYGLTLADPGGYLSRAYDSVLDVGTAGEGASFSVWVYRTGSSHTQPDGWMGYSPASADQGFVLYGTRPTGFPGNAIGHSRVDTGNVYGYSYQSATQVYNAWAHVVLTWNPVDRLPRLYINGVEMTDRYLQQTPLPSSNLEAQTGRQFLIGAINLGSGLRYVYGTIDEPAVWNRCLSPAEITDLYNSGTGKFYPFAEHTVSAASSLSAEIATAQAAVPEHGVSCGTQVEADVAEATGSIPEHGVAFAVGAPVVTATAAIPEHQVSWSAAVGAEVAGATASVLVPTVTSGIEVQATVAAATGEVLVPGLAAGVWAEVAGATAQVLEATVTGGGILAVPATATATVVTTGASIAYVLYADKAVGAGAVLEPTAFTGNIDAPVVTATAGIPTPTVPIYAVIATATGEIPTDGAFISVTITVDTRATATGAIPEHSATSGGTVVWAEKATATAVVLTAGASVGLEAPISTATAAIPTPGIGVGAWVDAATVTATAAVPEHAFTSGAGVGAATAGASAVVLTPGVSAGQQAPVSTATAVVLTPGVSSGIGVEAAIATAIASIPEHSVTAETEISGAIATATASVLVPTVSVHQWVQAQIAAATAQVLTHAVTAEAEVSASTATATAQIPTHSASGVVGVGAAIAAATAQVLTPAIGIGPWVNAVPATATAKILSPVLGPTGSVATATADVLTPTVGVWVTPVDAPTAVATVLTPILGAPICPSPATAVAQVLVPDVRQLTSTEKVYLFCG